MWRIPVMISAFKIISETGVAAGVRRIEALTSDGLMAYYEETEEEASGSSKDAEDNAGSVGREDRVTC